MKYDAFATNTMNKFIVIFYSFSKF